MTANSRTAWVERACRGYRRMLALLPEGIRQDDGAAMLDLFRALAAMAAERGRAALLVVWLRSLLDVMVCAMRVRWTRARAPGDAAFDDGSDAALRFQSCRRTSMIDTLRQDLRHSLRSLGRRPAFTLLGVVTFALGIGATTAIFSVVNGVLLRELTWDSPDRIIRLQGVEKGIVNREGTLAYPNFRDVADRATSFEATSAFDEWRPNLTGAGEPEQLDAALVNVEFFRVFGTRPAAGRFFEANEDVDGEDRVVVLSWGLWQRRFGGDPDVVGRVLRLNNAPHTVVGVAPREFEDPDLDGRLSDRAELWRPLGLIGVSEADGPSRTSSSFVAVARLRPGLTIERARDELAALSHALEQEHPVDNAGVSMTAIPIRDAIVGDVRPSLLLLLSAVVFVLAIAAANVGNLLLSRAVDRRHEIALRTALGASRRRVVGQILVETMVLAGAGSALGLLLAAVSLRPLMMIAGDFVPRGDGVTLSLPVLGFAFAVTLLAALVCGVVPALVAASADARAALGEGAKSGTASRRTLRFRRGLIVVENALAILLLVGAGLLGRSLWKLMSVDIGIDASNLLTFDVGPPSSTYPDASDVNAFYADLLGRLVALPGVTAVATVSVAPLTGGFDCNGAYVADRPAPAPNDRLCPETRTVTPSYFAATGVTLRRGRFLDDRDRPGNIPATVITEAAARAFWPGEDAMGRRLIFQGDTAEVVGIVSDVKHLRIQDDAPPLLYVTRAQGIVAYQIRRATVIVRTRVDPLTIAAAVRATVYAIDPDLSVAELGTMAQIVARSAAAPRFRTLLLGAFAALALLLAAIGIYGVVSYSVSQRTRELAIRSALGARAGTLVGTVVRDGLAPVALGLLLGLTGALALSPVLAAVLFGVTTKDPLVFLVVPAILLFVALIATLAPAYRATRADPMTVLRT